MRRFSLWAGAALVTGLVLTALVSLVWTPYDPRRVMPGERLLPPGFPHLLGTDRMGIDILSQLMVGARVCVIVGVVAVGLAVLAGVPLGMLAGQVGGWLEDLVMRITDVMYAFPALLLALLLAAVFRASIWTAMVAIGIATIPAVARVARGATLTVMSSDYVLAARSSGTTPLGVARRHVLPNIAPVVGVQASVSFGIAILAEAGLSYLGQGAGVSTPTWGRMLHESLNYLWSHPLQAVWPGLAIAGAVLGFNLLGDGLRDLLDPRLREER